MDRVTHKPKLLPALLLSSRSEAKGSASALNLFPKTIGNNLISTEDGATKLSSPRPSNTRVNPAYSRGA
jgi:hypothetical protein